MSTGSEAKFDFRLAAAVILLVATVFFIWQTIQGLSTRRILRMELAEISHVRYDLLNAGRWVSIVVPILEARIDALDFKAAGQQDLRPMVERSLNRLLDDVKANMSAKSQQPGLGGFLGGGNAMIADMMVKMLRPHVPEYAGVVLAELEKPETKTALKNYIKATLADGAKTTFGKVDTTWFRYILEHNHCADAAACKPVLERRILDQEEQVARNYIPALIASGIAFLLLLTSRPVLRPGATIVLMLFSIALLCGGVLTPMLEVEAKISRMGMTLLGEPVAFTDQVVYFQSKSVLEVFHTLITAGRPDMYVVGVLVLMFSIVFPTLKMLSLAIALYRPTLLKGNPVVKFFALDSSKWSMADVMALAIFMSFVAFNGLIANTMGSLRETGAQMVIPTDSSKILPGYHLFIGFCLASLFLSKKLSRGIASD